MTGGLPRVARSSATRVVVGAAIGAVMLTSGGLQPSAAVPAGARPAAPAPQEGQPSTDPRSMRDETAKLPRGWRGSTDRAWTLRGDAQGLHLLVADQGDAYAWRTAASLSEPGLETDRWVGNACLTESGSRAVVAYAPRGFTNQASSFLRGAFTAIVDLDSGEVTKLPVRASLAYHAVGCGEGERALLAQQRSPEETGRPAAATRLLEVDAARGVLTGSPVERSGQWTGAVPVAGGAVAARGRDLVRLGATPGADRVLATAAGTPAHVTAGAAGEVYFVDGDERGNAVVRVGAGPAGRVARGGELVATSAGSWAGLQRGAGGRVFVTGEDVETRALGAATRVAASADLAVSTTGAAVLTEAPTPHPRTQAQAWRGALTLAAAPEGETTPVDLSLKLVRTG